MRQESDSDGRASALDAVLADYLRRVDRGEKVDQAAFIAAHPEFADKLRAYFSNAADLCGAATPAMANVATPRGQERIHDKAVTGFSPGIGSARFRKIRFHAEGGLGMVSVALDTELGRNVALKEIRDRFADDVASQARFLLEAEVTGRLEHPGVVPVYGLGRFDNGRPYYAMRFIEGETLAKASDAIHQRDQDREQKRVALRRLIGRFLDVCNAVEYAHARGIIHRDLKPQNVMLGKYGETLVLDWGLTKSLDHGSRTEDSDETTLRPGSGSGSEPTIYGNAIGSPRYMSPEQAAGKLDQIGFATDIFGLGATLYHLLSGAPPIDADGREAMLDKAKRGDFPSPRERDSDVPIALDAICIKAMAVDPQDRYSSVRELRLTVQDWLDNEPISDLLATVDHFQALHAAHPDRGAYQERLGREFAVLSKVLQSMARYDESLTYAKRAVDLLGDLLSRKPTDVGRFEELFLARTQLANILRAMAREDEARQLQEANKLDVQRMIKQSSGTPEVQEEFITLSLHQGFSVAEAEKLLNEHLGSSSDFAPFRAGDTLDTSDFAKDHIDQQESDSPSHETLPLPFQTPNDKSRYTLLGTLGIGGAGTVYRARDNKLLRIVALKTANVSSERGSVSRHQVRFSFEACVLATLSHRNIIPLYELGTRDDGAPFFTTKLVHGRSWLELAEDQPSSRSERIAYWRKLLQGFVEVCDALQHAHEKGVIHCDPKPSNVIVDADGRPWVIDWGVCHIMDPARSRAVATEDEASQRILFDFYRYLFPDSENGVARGTPVYMSPEQVVGSRIDARSDVFVLGASLFTLLTGQAPFSGGTIMEILKQRTAPGLVAPSPKVIDPSVPNKLAIICTKAMDGDPSHRYQSALELGTDVRRWLNKSHRFFSWLRS
jgi:serine/threonine protein kinase